MRVQPPFALTLTAVTQPQHNFFVCNGNYVGMRNGEASADAWGLPRPVLLRRGTLGILDA